MAWTKNQKIGTGIGLGILGLFIAADAFLIHKRTELINQIIQIIKKKEDHLLTVSDYIETYNHAAGQSKARVLSMSVINPMAIQQDIDALEAVIADPESGYLQI